MTKLTIGSIEDMKSTVSIKTDTNAEKARKQLEYMTEKQERILISVRMPKKLKNTIRRYGTDNQMKDQDVIIEAITKHLDYND